VDERDVNPDVLAQTIRSAGSPLHINMLTRTAVRAWPDAQAGERRYAPGSQYRVGETVLLDGQCATVEAAGRGENPLQGPFTILTLRFPDGTERLMAAEVPGAPVEDHQPVTEEQVEEMLGAQGTAIRRAVRAALQSDPRFVSFQTTQGECWCLEEMLPRIDEEILRKVLGVLSQVPEPERGRLPSQRTEELVRAAWGLEDDGGAVYDLHAFALGRALAERADVVNLGDRCTSAEAWKVFTTRFPIAAPRISTQVTLPDGVEPALEEQVRREQRRETTGEGEEPEVGRPEEDLETWREDRPVHAVFTLRARHYYEGWLPLTGQVRRLFPHFASGRQEVVFHHHFGDEPGSFRAWVDHGRGRIWVSPEMHETFRRHRIYPGARLRISARNEQEYDIATRPTDRTAPIRVWRMWLDENGRIQYEAFEEPRRYDVADDVYVADVRFEDLKALFLQAEEVGDSVFGLMYRKAVEWWEARGRDDLIVTADQLFKAIHFDEEGRMVSKATIAWELWQRLAFEPLGGGRYRFRPEFGDRRRSVMSTHPRRRRRRPPRPRSECLEQVRRLVGQEIRTLKRHRPFRIVEMDDEVLHIHVGTTGKPRSVQREEIEGAWEHLVRKGEVTRAEIRQRYSEFNPAYVAAILAALPGVIHQVHPIRLTYRPHRGEGSTPPLPTPALERTRSGQLVAAGPAPTGSPLDGTPVPKPGQETERAQAEAELETIREIARELSAGEIAQAPPDYVAASDTLVTEDRMRREWIRQIYAALYSFIKRLIHGLSVRSTRPRDASVSNEPVPAQGPGPTDHQNGALLPRRRPRRRSEDKGGDMQAKTLFSHHYLRHRLPDHPEWQEDPRSVFEAVRALWQKARKHGDSWNEAQTEEEFVKPVLELLGWSYIVQPKAKKGGKVSRPDYALFPDEKTRDEAYRYQGQDAPFYNRALAIAEAKYWGRSLSQKDASGRDTWKADSNPSFQMVNYLVGTGVPWGILTNGIVWRLYSREVSSTASEFYEVDLGAIFDFLPPDGEPSPEQMDQFRRWWLFFRRDAFLPDAQGKSFIQRVHGGSATYARQISDKLKELVFERVMPEIAGGFIAYRYHELGIREETEESLQQIYQASLSLLYKLLFLLYAEARGLLPITNPGYREQSLTALAQWAAQRLDRRLPLSNATHATPRYDALLALFHRIDQGDPSLGIPRYNGGLFNPTSPENRFLEQHRLSDRAVACAVDTLVRDAGQPVDYAYISVRNLGSIYEGLLENKLRVVDAAAGKVELVNDKGERKATGSYYTPDYIVEYIVQHTLDPILDERDETFRAAMDRCADLRRKLKRASNPSTVRLLRGQLDEAERKAQEAFLGIKVLDPAMGSGHFLVNAVDHLTDGIIQRMQIYHDEHPDVPWEWNPIQRLIERVRGEILEEMERQGIAVDPARLDDTALLTRLVMKRCVYGVDLNRMAVELAKVSLWLHSFTVGAPLSFLDHHLRWGNSLIGTDVRTVEREIQATDRGEGVQLGLFAGPFAGLLDLTGLMVEVAERADATLADVQRSAEVFEEFQRQLTPYKQVLDLWVSQYLGNKLAYEFLSVQGADVLPALRGETEVPEKYQGAIERARELWREKRFFHWDLEFPEVFVDLRKRDWAENPGFDAVIGNPPYVRSIRLKDADPVAWAYYARIYRAAARREFDIYLCFVEQGASLLNPHGRFGMILPNKWFTSRVGESLRSLLAGRRIVEHIVDFGDFQVFEGVTTYTCLLFLSGSPRDEVKVAILDEAEEDAQPLPGGEGEWQTGVVPVKELSADTWTFALGPAGSLLGKLRELPCLEDFATVFMGTGTRADQVFLMERQGDRFYSRSLGQWVEIEGEIMRPSLTGRDIDPYYYETDNYLLFPYRLVGEEAYLIPSDEMAAKYPKAWAYLNKPINREILEKRDKGKFKGRKDWYCHSYPRNMHLLGLPKLVLPDVADRAEFACDFEGRYIIDTVYAIRPRKGVRVSLLTLAALLNSSVMTFFLQRTGTKLRGGYFRMKTAYLNPFPIPRIVFTTPLAERERLVEEGITEAAEFIEHTEGTPSVPFSTFSASVFCQWLDQRLSPIHTPDPELVRQHNADPLNEDWQLPEEGPVEQSDVVHDLLAHLAERMVEMNKEKQAEVRGFLAWLEREIGASVDDLTGKTRLRNYSGDYQKGEPHLTLEELLAILRKNRRRLKVDPSRRAFQERLEQEYRASLGKLLPLKARLAATDRLIDLIVYRLYGLTEEEVAIVEGSVA